MNRLARAVIATACIAAVAAPAAQAAKDPVYDVRIKGSEAITWEYNPVADGCFNGGHGFGSQHVRYDTGKVRLVGVKPGTGDRAGLLQFSKPDDADLLRETGIIGRIDGKVSVEREGEINTSATCGGTDGDPNNVPQEPPPVDCGVRNGHITLKAGFWSNRRFVVEGDYHDFGPAGSPAPDIFQGEALGLTYENCAWLLPPDISAVNDEIEPLSKQIKPKKLPKKGKTVKFSIGRHVDYEAGDRKGDLTYAANITIKRVK